jgi:hypothetical protein
MHGDIEALERANGVRKSDVWFILNGNYFPTSWTIVLASISVSEGLGSRVLDFSMVLATIAASLANFLKLPESDISLLDIMGEGDEQHNLEDDKVAAAEPAGEKSDISTISNINDKRVPLPTASSFRPQSKKKVAESWEDEEVGDSVEGLEAKEDEGGVNDRSVEELEQGFKKIYKAFSKLRSEFDTKFRVIFA